MGKMIWKAARSRTSADLLVIVSPFHPLVVG